MIKGKYSYCDGDPTILWDIHGTKLIIGNFCSIAKNLTVYLGGNHNINWVSTYPFGHIHTATFNTFSGKDHPSTRGDVVIGNDVWIGGNVTIMSGVTIGDGAVIANNSHVVKNVEPYSLVGGNPAKFIKYRFTRRQISKLMELRWWDWDDEEINKVAHLLCNSDIEMFIGVAKLYKK